jgi:predicted site-specific integrase-resolvase
MNARLALQLLGRNRRTLSRYVKEGKIRAIRLPNRTLNYNEDDVYSMTGKSKVRMNVIYARVSTYKQKKDLQNQIDNIEA